LNLATDKVINSRDDTWLNKVCGEWKGLSLPTRPETVTLLPIEAVKEIKAVAEKKDHGGGEREVEPDPKPLPCFSAIKNEPERKPVLAQKKAKPVLPPRRMSTRATKIDEEAPTGEGALKELARLGGETLNPEAQTLAERLREGVEIAAFALTESNVTAPTITMIDRFGADIGSFAEYGFTVQDLDPSKYKDTFEV